MSSLASIVLPAVIFGINTAFFETDKQADAILRRSSKVTNEDQLRAESQTRTKRRAIVNMGMGFVSVFLYSVFVQETFLLLSSMTFFCHTLWYLYLVWHNNEIYIKVLTREPFEANTSSVDTHVKTNQTINSTFRALSSSSVSVDDTDVFRERNDFVNPIKTI